MQQPPICYRELDWPMEKLTEQLLSYFGVEPATGSNLQRSGFWRIDHLALLYNCPELVKFFDHWGWRVASAHVYTIDSTTGAGPIHKDYISPTIDYYSARINFPLWGCDQGETLWYTVDPASYAAANGPGAGAKHGYWGSNDPNPVEIARVVLKKPTIMRIDQAHQVRLTGPTAIRSSLTIKVTPDPVSCLCS
jgi:hypothetical protein